MTDFKPIDWDAWEELIDRYDEIFRRAADTPFGGLLGEVYIHPHSTVQDFYEHLEAVLDAADQNDPQYGLIKLLYTDLRRYAV